MRDARAAGAGGTALPGDPLTWGALLACGVSLAFLVAACRWLPISEEREAIGSYVWHKRGTEAGELLRAYCMGGSTRERRWMLEALTYHASPAKVTIVCPD